MNAALSHPLASQGIDTRATIHPNLGTAQLVERAVANGEGELSKWGSLVVKTTMFGSHCRMQAAA